MVKNYVGGIN